MLNILSIGLWLAVAQQSGTVITADEIAATLKNSIANNVVDAPVKLADVPGGKVSLAVLRRTKAETTALIHDRVTEIYQIVEGSGTLVTGGTPTFPLHARREGVECSPGTCVLWDANSLGKLPDLDFQNAAVLLTRVISRPASNWRGITFTIFTGAAAGGGGGGGGGGGATRKLVNCVLGSASK